MNCHRRANWLWGAAWLLAMGLIALNLVNFRQSILINMSTPQAQQDWDAVRDAARIKNEGSGPVKQRVPQSAEPPALVLMRDHFAVLLGAGFVFGTALFAMTVISVKGVLWRRPQEGTRSGAVPPQSRGKEL